MEERLLRSYSLAIASVILVCSLNLVAQTNPPEHKPPYPAHWWSEISSIGAPSWEVLPQRANYNEVILSKRNELGLLSNFAATPFTYRAKKYASVEGFWQSLKYPENKEDSRNQLGKLKWPHTRQQVEQMTAFEAKDAGNLGSDNMKTLGIDWVSFEGKHLVYKEKGESPFYWLIVEVMRAKMDQNPEVKKLLLQTDSLILMPDHDSGPVELRAWQYHRIWMQFRNKLKANKY